MSGGKVDMTINFYINIGGGCAVGNVSNILIYMYDGMEHSGGSLFYIVKPLRHYKGVITYCRNKLLQYHKPQNCK